MEGEGLKNWIKIINNPQRCGSEEAWEEDENSKSEFHSCTLAIAKSGNLHLENIRKIQEISQLSEITLKQLKDNIWSSFEDMTFKDQQDESKNFNRTLGRIVDVQNSKIDQQWNECSDTLYCVRAFRKIILQLKLIQLGYYGPYGATAGMYLAQHKEELGSYFTNSEDNNWPHQPLSYYPNPKEKLLNEYMIKLTYALSDITNSTFNRWQYQLLNEDINNTEINSRRLGNISILDFPAFGSRVPNLTKFFINEPNWPLEVNFAILNRYMSTELSEKFRTQKHLIKLWETYMNFILKEETTQSNFSIEAPTNQEDLSILWTTHMGNISRNETKFTPDVANIPLNPFDFTKNIEDDFLTFVQVYMQSHLTGTDTEKMNGVWIDAAELVFGSTLDKTVVQSNGLFDSLFLDCSFQEQFMTEELAGGCNLFQQSLTSNGLCLSFNTETPSNIWNDDMSFAKALEEIGATKPMELSNFGGTGPNEGIL